jgi:signal transduction histidine kinase/FixJ family two-component response regulator
MSVSAQRQDGPASSAVRCELIRTLYRQSVGISVVNPLNAAIVAAVLWPSPYPVLLVGWVIAMAAVTVARVVLRSKYLQVLPPPEQTTPWARRFVTGAVASGLLWGLAGALFYDPRFLAQLLVIFVIAGMVAGASGTLALHLPAFLGFAGAAVLPTAARLLLEGGRLHVAMAVIAIIYGCVMSLVAANTHRAVSEAFRLRFENRELLDQLLRAQISIAEANRTLEQRVADRSLALERQAEALRDAQRMESIGLLAGGVAHDFNNLLTVILGNVELLLGQTHLVSGDADALKEIRQAAQRGAILVSQLLAFSRRQVMVPRILDLNGVVSDVLPLLGPLVGEHIQLAVTMHPAPLAVKADATQLQQVIINLATNARDAMPSGGKLTIETTLMDGTAAGTTLPADRYAVLTVNDTGVGMNDDIKKMAFHPFFTTKEVGSGTGLGLATVKGIVEQSSGHVFVESEPGQGSRFHVYLPWSSAELAESLVAAPDVVITSARRATILVAEDEESVRELTARCLRAAEFEVIEAEDGERALEAAALHDGPIDLLITDVVMPRLGGLELAKRLVEARPGLPVLFVSGYSREQLPAGGDANAPIAFLQKPYTPTELIQRVSQILPNSLQSGWQASESTDSTGRAADPPAETHS